MSYYSNLYKDTLDILKEYGKTFDDVQWCGSPDYYMTPERFKELASGTQYDASYGSQEVARDLLVVGDGFWLERHEYDGSEWWEFKAIPTKPDRPFTQDVLKHTYGYVKLSDLEERLTELNRMW